MNLLAIATAPAAALMLTPVPAAVVDEGVAEAETGAVEAVRAEVAVAVEAEAGAGAQMETEVETAVETATPVAEIEAAAEAQIDEAGEERVAARIIDIRADDASALDEAAAEAAQGAAPVQLVSWDGDFELMKTSRRLRIWRSHIAYNLTVDAEGKATGCELTETFRMRRVSDTLCEVLMAHHTFEPAHNAEGAAIEGNYSSRISYQEMLERL